MKVIDRIIELKEMMAELKANTEATNQKIDQHIDWCAKRDVKVDELQEQVSEAQGAIKIMKFAGPLVVAATVAITKLLNGSSS
jgi:hypothetical protein